MYFLNFNCNTSGTGPYSTVAKKVKIVGLDVVYSNIYSSRRLCEIRVFFDPRTWNVEEDGYFYGDKKFLYRFISSMRFRHIKWFKDYRYSRRGIVSCGHDYVGMEVNTALADWLEDNSPTYTPRYFSIHRDADYPYLQDLYYQQKPPTEKQLRLLEKLKKDRRS